MSNRHLERLYGRIYLSSVYTEIFTISDTSSQPHQSIFISGPTVHNYNDIVYCPDTCLYE